MRRSVPARSRSVLIWSVVTFLVLQIGISLGLDVLAPLARFPSARKILRVSPSSPDVVFFGSSRLGASICQSEINRLLAAEFPSSRPRVVNASVPAGDAISAEFLLDQFFSRSHRPDWVILELSPENLNFPGPWLGPQILRQLGWREAFTHFPEAVCSNDGMRYLGGLLLPTYLHRERLIEAVSEWWDPPRPPLIVDDVPAGSIDWKAILPPANVVSHSDHRVRLYPGALAARRWLRNYRVQGQTLAALERILQRCKDRHVGVVLLLPPLATVHREEYLNPIETEFRRHLQRLQQTYACQVVDARDWLTDDYFRDASHPNIPSGQLRFSRLLTRRILLGLFEQSQIALQMSLKD